MTPTNTLPRTTDTASREALHQMIQRLSNPWWSPAPGSRYVAQRTADINDVGGPCLTAWQHPGAFNLYWLLCGMGRPQDHDMAFYRATAGIYRACQQMATFELDGHPLGEWAALLGPGALIAKLDQHQTSVRAWPWHRVWCGVRSGDDLLDRLHRLATVAQ